ncbi:MAG: serine/threonine protein kinase [Gammaproteobacteria bacterium]|jgi:Ser/Thr protein kinase RdoA (MazF antagonist)
MVTSESSNDGKHPYDALTPDTILDAVEALGLEPNGRLLALNSYENRVYQIGIEDHKPVVAKFYRPGRWSNEAIIEEHRFTQALAQSEIPVVPPMTFTDSAATLHEHAGYRFAVYSNCGGRWPELDDPDKLMWIGRFIGRIHALGKARDFEHRPRIDIDSYGWSSLRYLMENGFIPEELRVPYQVVAEQLLQKVEDKFGIAGDVYYFRIHGDCHPGNILWTDEGPHFVDFDDTRMGPAVQDIWMLLSGDRRDMTAQLCDILEGYTEFCDFNAVELNLLEALRSLRMIHYSAWLAKRWDDPTFPKNFPWFNTVNYWEEQILTLKEQLALMDEQPLVWR